MNEDSNRSKRLEWAALVQRSILMAALIGLATFIVFRALELAFWVLVIVLLAVILATAMMPIVRLLRTLQIPPGNWRIPKAIAAISIYAGVALVLGLMIYAVGAPLVREVVRFSQGLPEVVTNLLLSIESTADSLGLSGLLPSPNVLSSQVQGFLGQAFEALSLAGAAIGGLVGLVFRFFIVLILALFLVVESDNSLSFIVRLFPASQRGKVRGVAEKVGDKIGRWVLAQLAVASIAGILAGVAAFLLGLPYPILIGAGTAIVDLAPAVGPALMAVPVFFLGLSESLLFAIVAAAIFTALSILDGNVISPLIAGRAVRLSPALVITAATLGLALYGAVGGLIAIPVAAALHVVVQEVVIPWLDERN